MKIKLLLLVSTLLGLGNILLTKNIHDPNVDSLTSFDEPLAPIGPAGEIPLTHQLIVVATHGDDLVGDGSVGSPYASFGKALEVATGHLVAGRAVWISMAPGLYREGEYLWREWDFGGAAATTPLVIEGQQLDGVVLSGADVWTSAWTDEGNSVWSHPWPYDWGLGPDPWPGTTGSLPDEMRRREMLVIDGVRMDPVFDIVELRHGTYYVDEALDTIWFMGQNPNLAQVEVPVRSELLEMRGKSNLTLRNVVMQHYNGFIGEPGAIRIWGNSDVNGEPTSTNVLVEDCRFYANSANGMSLSIVRDSTVRRCIFDDCGFLNFSMSRTRNSLIEDVMSTRANWRGFPQNYLSWSTGGAKVTSTEDMIVRRFVAAQNLTNGFWFDINNRRNLVEEFHGYYNANHAVYFELSPGPLTLDGAWLGGNTEAVYVAEVSESVVRNVVGSHNRDGLVMRNNNREWPLLNLTAEDNDWVASGSTHYLARRDWSVDDLEMAALGVGSTFQRNRYTHAAPDQAFGIPQRSDLAGWQALLSSNGVTGADGDAQASTLPMSDDANSPVIWQFWDGLAAPSLAALQTHPAFVSNSHDAIGERWMVEDVFGREGNFGARATALLRAPVTGSYTLRLSADAEAEVWLSTDDNPANASRVLEVAAATDYRATSGPTHSVALIAGQHYWIELLHVGTGSAAHVSLLWQRPDEVGFTPISAVHIARPTINISAPVAIASEEGATNGALRITRNGSAHADMAVNFSVSGTADAGVDYDLTASSPVIIPAGSNYVDITLTPVDDAFGEPTEAVVVSLIQDWTLNIGSGASATVSIEDNDPLWASQTGSGEVTLTWEDAVDEVAYEIAWQAAGAADWTTFGGIIAADSTAETIAGLATETLYTFRKRPVYSGSNGPWLYTQFTLFEGFIQDSGAAQLVVIEAENFTSNSANGSADSWQETTTFADYLETAAMQALPDDGMNTYEANTGPQLDFLVRFVAAGTHYLWVRCREPDGSNSGDSLHAGINGTLPASATLIEQQENGSGIGTIWVYAARIRGGSRITLDVPSAGLHTINIWPREDGIIVDRILLTTDPNYVPTDLESESTFFGPPPATPDYASWATNYNLTGADALETADPDRDGIINYLERALGSNPLQASTASLPVITEELLESGRFYMVMTVSRNPEISDVAFIVEASNDLGAWNHVEGVDIVTLIDTADTLQVRTAVPIDAADTTRFLRLRVVPAP